VNYSPGCLWVSSDAVLALCGLIESYCGDNVLAQLGCLDVC
jgi:hypothetical protein